MFGFLKNLGKPPQAELVAYEDGVIHFRCAAQLAPEKRVNLHCRLPEGEEFGAVVEVMAHYPQTGLYTGFVDQPKDANKFLAMLLPVPFQERRKSPRIRKRVRLLSRDIPGYKSMTENISADGFCTLLEGPIEAERLVEVELDLDQAGLRPMQLQVLVRWCAATPEGRQHLVGCEFHKLSNSHRHTITKFLESVGAAILS